MEQRRRRQQQRSRERKEQAEAPAPQPQVKIGEADRRLDALIEEERDRLRHLRGWDNRRTRDLRSIRI